MSNTTSGDDIRSAFQRIWGYQDFRPPQQEIIQCLLSQQDALIIMPTGGGKSICFQLPALLQTGLTLVVSPLVALMENQVLELRQLQLPVGMLHSELSSIQKRQTYQALQQNRLRLLYLSPETLLSKSVWERLCDPEVKINGLILDEAHCLVQWGDVFRPAYRRLGEVRSHLLKSKSGANKIPIAAFTATADPRSQQLIQTVLKLQTPAVFQLSPYRANLHLKVEYVCTPRSRRQKLLKFIQSHPNQCGLIYVRTRQDSEFLAEWLAEKGYHTAAYHAGLGANLRRSIEKAWLSGELKFVISTSAFGMGVNKSDVRWVAHFHPPLILSEYIQEIGRGGRDGEKAEALTLICEPTGWLYPEDQQRQKFFEERLDEQYRSALQLAKQLPHQGQINEIIKEFPDAAIALSLLHSTNQLIWKSPFEYEIKSLKNVQSSTQLEAIKMMNQYLYTRECRWRFLLRVFGFAKPMLRCGCCDNC